MHSQHSYIMCTLLFFQHHPFFLSLFHLQSTFINLHRTHSALLLNMKPLPPSKADHVKTLVSQGKSTRQVARELQVSHGFVTKIRLQDKENLPEPTMGRPAKVSKRTRQALKTKFLTNDFEDENNRYMEAQEYICSVGEDPVHRETIRRYLRAEGVMARVKPEAPFLTNKHKKTRHKFARDHATDYNDLVSLWLRQH